MVHDGHAIPRHAEVELQHVDPELDGALERGNRVLGEQPAGAAVPLDFDRVGGHDAESAKQRDEHGAPQESQRESVRPDSGIR